MAIVAAFALVSALSQRSLVAAMIACPITLGPIVAHALTSTWSAVLAGLLSALFWALLAIFVVNPFILRLYGSYQDIDAYSPYLYSAVILSSIVGGYLGARVSLY